VGIKLTLCDGLPESGGPKKHANFFAIQLFSDKFSLSGLIPLSI
jgi:hypothetical protein